VHRQVGVLDPLVVIAHQLEPERRRVQGESEAGDGEAGENRLGEAHDFILPRAFR
jgi:hypothetical protein